MSPRSSLLMVSATILWGGHYVLAGVAIAEVSPFELTLVRWLIAAGPLVLIAQLVERPDWRAALRELPRLVLLAALGMIAYNLLLYMALEHTTAIGAALVNAANPATMTLLAALLARERLHLRVLIGIAVCFFGILLVVSGGSIDTLLSLDFNGGQILMLGAIIVWSLYSIIGRTQKVPPITSTAAQAVIVVLAMAPFAPFAQMQVPTDTSAMWAILYIGVAPSIGSYVLWNIALRTTPSGTASIFLNLITVSAIAIGAAMGLEVTWIDVAGAVIIAGGVAVASMPRSHRTPTESEEGPEESVPVRSRTRGIVRNPVEP